MSCSLSLLIRFSWMVVFCNLFLRNVETERIQRPSAHYWQRAVSSNSHYQYPINLLVNLNFVKRVRPMVSLLSSYIGPRQGLLTRYLFTR
jgi:hypothetical protein